MFFNKKKISELEEKLKYTINENNMHMSILRQSELYHHFYNTFKKNYKIIKHYLDNKDYNKKNKDIFELIHLMKSESYQFEMYHFVNECHNIETLLTNDLNEIIKDELIKKLSELDSIFNKVNLFLGDIFEKEKTIVEITKDEYVELKKITTNKTAKRFIGTFNKKLIRFTIENKIRNLFYKTCGMCSKKGHITFKIQNIRVTNHTLDVLTTIIIQLVKNSISHGIPENDGEVTVSLYKEDGMINLWVSDNGKGIDIKKVLSVAKQKELVKKGQNITRHDTIEFIFNNGLSTKDEISYVSGRGIGLDYVKRIVEKKRGNIKVYTSDKGTIFHIRYKI
jgi:two-component system chemotaxis sensor kinase CheA